MATTRNKDRFLMDIIDKIKSIGPWGYDLTMEFCWFVTTCSVVSTKRELQMKELNFALPFINCVYVNGDQYVAYKNQKSDIKTIEKYFAGDIGFFNKMQNRKLAICTNSKAKIKYLQSLKSNELSNEELAKEFKSFTDAYILSLALCWTRPYDFLDEALMQVIENELQLTGDEAAEVLGKIVTNPNSYYPLCYCEEPLALLKIAKESKNKWHDLLSDHIDKYSWMKAPLLAEEVEFTKAEYLKRLEFLATEDIDDKIKMILETREANDQEYAEIIKKFKFSPRGLAIAKAMRDNIFMHTNTAEHSDELLFKGRKTLLKEISKRTNIDLRDLMMLDGNEIYEVTKTNQAFENMEKLIAERKKGNGVVWLEEETTTFFGDEARMIYDFFRANVKNEKPDDINRETIAQVQGKVANSGKVVGVVKILLDYEDIHKVEKGDIIVTPMTTPDFVSAMEKAAGFITDAGGITSHAAILSREFDVPCIVGTNNATEVLKDGQTIELDAFIGIVTVIKESE